MKTYLSNNSLTLISNFTPNSIQEDTVATPMLVLYRYMLTYQNPTYNVQKCPNCPKVSHTCECKTLARSANLKSDIIDTTGSASHKCHSPS